MARRLLLLVLITAWTLTYAPGCGGGTKSDTEAASPKPDTGLVAQSEICETLPAPDSTPGEAAGLAPTKTETKPEAKPVPKPEPEPPAKPKVLPRMWDYGSENCIPCKTMKGILDPMIVDYRDKVDIRIINVYEEKELAQQARIQIIPTQIFYNPDGKELYRHVGVYTRDSIVGKFKELGWE